MADIRRLVTLNSAGSATLVTDFETSTVSAVRDSFKVVPGVPKPVLAQRARRYGGAKQVGESHENGNITMTLLITGATTDACLQSLSNILSVSQAARTDLFFEWRPDGATSSVFYEIAGPAQWNPNYRWITMASSSHAIEVDFIFPVYPLARLAPVTTTIHPSLGTLPLHYVGLASVTGDAPALADITVRTSGGSNAPIWAMFAWWKRPTTYQRLINGDFETNTNGWLTTGLTHNTQPTSFTRITSQFKYGVASGQVVSPALVTNGPEYIVYQPFKAGVTYTAKAWVRAASGAENLAMGFGISGDSVQGSTVAASTTWQEITATWTPSFDRTFAVVAPRHVAATAYTWEIDGVRVYEGTTEPTISVEGAGAPAPVGIHHAQQATAFTTFARTTDAGALSGTDLELTTSGAGTASASFAVDPSSMEPDDFSADEIDIEVWAKIIAAGTVVTPRVVTSLVADSGLGQPTYTSEFGSVGKLIPKPSSGLAWRFVRLGVLTMPVDRLAPVKWRIKLDFSWAAGSSSVIRLDYIMCVPARQRALGKTGVPNDSYYADFIATTADTTKTIRSNLSGQIGSAALNKGRDAGLGGSLIEFPPGNVDVLLKLSSLVPDDPTSDTTSEQTSHTGVNGSITVTPRVFVAKGA